MPRPLTHVNDPWLRTQLQQVQQARIDEGLHMREIENLLKQYVDVRRRRHGVLSTGLAIKALKQIVPACSVPDRDLANMIAYRAIDRGLAVHFDIDG
jgi:hypothetical protein